MKHSQASALATAALAEALLASVTAAHRQGSPHVDTPGLCTALAIAVGVQSIAATGGKMPAVADVMAATTKAVTGLGTALRNAAARTLQDLDAGLGDEMGLSTRDLLAQHTAHTAAHGLFTKA
jgi:hypothetical protein